MGKYGEAAEIAVTLMGSQITTDPRRAWAQAVEQVFHNSPSGRAKSCPKGSFLGLCEEGVVAGITSGTYNRSIENKNKAYAVRAVGALRENPALSHDQACLWRLATAGASVTANHQMDVVCRLWRKGLIILWRDFG